MKAWTDEECAKLAEEYIFHWDVVDEAAIAALIRAAVDEARREAFQWVLDHKQAAGEQRIRITTDFEDEIAAILARDKEPRE